MLDDLYEVVKQRSLFLDFGNECSLDLLRDVFLKMGLRNVYHAIKLEVEVLLHFEFLTAGAKRLWLLPVNYLYTEEAMANYVLDSLDLYFESLLVRWLDLLVTCRYHQGKLFLPLADE